MLRWLAPAVLPAILVVLLIRWRDKRREPLWLVLLTLVFGAVGAMVSLFLEARAAHWTGLDVRTSVAGDRGALTFVFLIAAPLREASKVAACWPAFRSKHFDEPYDGIVYSSAAALGFVAVENGFVLHANPVGATWYLRAGLALTAHVFFAMAWGYALGRAKQSKRPGAIFPTAWLGATFFHALFIHFVYGRGQTAMLVTAPLLMVMGVFAYYAARDLRSRSERPSIRPGSSRLSRVSLADLSAPPSLRAVREALRRTDQPIKVHWILAGALVTIGAMLLGLAAAVAVGYFAQVDFSSVDDRDLTPGPVALLGAGLLAAFPTSGFLVAKASSAQSLLEPALAAALALLLTLVALGFTAPVAVVFALAFSPIAWGLSCAGAWVGRPEPE